MIYVGMLLPVPPKWARGKMGLPIPPLPRWWYGPMKFYRNSILTRKKI